MVFAVQRSPPTALRMLEEYVALQPGDTVIQNGANSAVGRNVIQLCRAAGPAALPIEPLCQILTSGICEIA